jgi:hypothetical protein
MLHLATPQATSPPAGYPFHTFAHIHAGYFTSRPTQKGYIRELSSYLQAARQLLVLAALHSPPPSAVLPSSIDQSEVDAEYDNEGEEYYAGTEFDQAGAGGSNGGGKAGGQLAGGTPGGGASAVARSSNLARGQKGGLPGDGLLGDEDQYDEYVSWLLNQNTELETQAAQHRANGQALSYAEAKQEALAASQAGKKSDQRTGKDGGTTRSTIKSTGGSTAGTTGSTAATMPRAGSTSGSGSSSGQSTADAAGRGTGGGSTIDFGSSTNGGSGTASGSGTAYSVAVDPLNWRLRWGDGPDALTRVQALEAAVALAHHHDAITGTDMQVREFETETERQREREG